MANNLRPYSFHPDLGAFEVGDGKSLHDVIEAAGGWSSFITALIDKQYKGYAEYRRESERTRRAEVKLGNANARKD